MEEKYAIHPIRQHGDVLIMSCARKFSVLSATHAMINNDSILLSQRDCVTKPRVVAACRYPGKLAPNHLTNPNGVASAA
jgi:hypothetical protein